MSLLSSSLNMIALDQSGGCLGLRKGKRLVQPVAPWPFESCMKGVHVGYSEFPQD